MIAIIAHRANLAGRSNRENHPDDIRRCLDAGFGVEVDLWSIDGSYWTGHDRPTYPIDLEEFDREGVVFHLKAPVVPVLAHADAFAIDLDPFTLTLRGRIWANYGQPVSSNSIMCSPELVGAAEALQDFLGRITGALGVCTDHPEYAKEVML